MNDKRAYLVWDLPLRIFHWLLVILICFSWYSVEIEENLDWHFISGYCVLALILFRVIWGFIGTHHSQFRNMLYGPGTIMGYAKGVFSKTERNYAGHNPLGSLSAFALLLLVLVQVITGLFANDEDYYFGPLSEYVSIKTADRLTEIHHLNFNVLTVFIGLHILAVVFYLLFKKQNLAGAMVTGKKKLEGDSSQAIPHSRLVKALLTLLFTASAVYCLVIFA